MKTIFSEKERNIMTALAQAALPPGKRVTVLVKDTTALAEMERLLASGTRIVRFLIRMLLWVFHLSAILTAPKHCTFLKLSDVDRMNYLQSWAHSRVYLKRMGIKSLLVMFMIHYYADPLVKNALGFCDKRPIVSWPEEFKHDYRWKTV